MKKLKVKDCCKEKEVNHPDHTKELHRINRIIGQVEGVRRMILSGKYCPEIIMQIQAVRAALKVLEVKILKKHLETCIKEAYTSGSQIEREKKLQELLDLVKKN